MRSLRIVVLLGAVCWTASAAAQNPTPAAPADSLSATANQSWTNPSYQQPRQITPMDLARAKEQVKTQQRLNRIAARKWFGLSNNRPTASPTPWAGGYSPTWVSNSALPFMWSGVGGYW